MAGMNGNSNKISIVAIILAALSIVLSVSLLIWFCTSNPPKESAESPGESDAEGGADIAKERSLARPDFCDLMPDPGPCGSQVRRFYYLERVGDCLEFPWGGCQGNDNNFLSFLQCRSACRVPRDKPWPKGLVREETKELVPRLHIPRPTAAFDIGNCKLGPDAGPCTDRITRYYFDNGSCRKFDYGGCAGNQNNFFTEAECERNCKDTNDNANEFLEMEMAGTSHQSRPQVPTKPRVCTLPEDSGDCEESQTRYRWSQLLEACVAFQWSGCGGNGNNFISLDKCQKRCAV